MKNLFSLTSLNLIKTTCISMFRDYPMFAIFLITSRCNFRCEFCHVYNENNFVEDLTTEQVFTIIDALAYAGVSFVYLTGGEALVRNDIEEILKYIKTKNMYVMLATNGSLFKEKYTAVSKYIDDIHFSIQTIQNFNEITKTSKQTFYNVCQSIKLAIKAKIPTQINIPIDKNNINEMPSIMDFIKREFGNKVNAFFIPVQCLSLDEKDNIKIKELLPNIQLFNKNLLEIKNKYKTNVNHLDRQLEIEKNKYKSFGKELCKAGNNIIVVNASAELEYPCEYCNFDKQKIKVNNVYTIKNFLKEVDKLKLNNNKLKYCTNCLDSCYLQPSYFLTFKGFYNIVTEYFKKIF